jgi:GR25 family glycosyltransferase involved in LPS biosynthesis
MGGLERLADGILVINLDERPDRWRAVMAELAPHVDTGRLQRLPAVKGTALEGFGKPPLFRGRGRDKTWAGRAGCALSHREAIAFAKRQGWRSVLILEDDIQLAEDFTQVCDSLAESLVRNPWDICYLGFTDPVGPFREIADLYPEHKLYSIYGCNTTHAYLVRDTAYVSLLKQMPDRGSIWIWLTRNRAIDRWYARRLSRLFRVLAVSPSIIQQKQGVSDITGRNQEYCHITAVPADAVTMLPHRLARGLRRLGFTASNVYDSLRGRVKQSRGF